MHNEIPTAMDSALWAALFDGMRFPSNNVLLLFLPAADFCMAATLTHLTRALHGTARAPWVAVHGSWRLC